MHGYNILRKMKLTLLFFNIFDQIYFINQKFGLIAAWFCMTIVGFIVCGVIKDKNLPGGDPAKLSSPVDYLGHTCGYHSSVSDKPYGYYMANTAGIFYFFSKTFPS